MTATPLWVPISAAAAALLGGGFGAMLQGRYGVSGWRRQIRLEAYTAFVNATHNFNNRLLEALDAIGEPDFQDKWSKVREAEWAIGRAGSLVCIAGPLSMDAVARQVVENTRSITRDGKDPDILASIAQDRKSDRRYKKNKTWIESASYFEKTGRKVLRTDKFGQFSRDKTEL